MKKFEQIMYILASFVSRQMNAEDEVSSRDKNMRDSIKKEFTTYLIKVILGLFLIIIFTISLSSINNQMGLSLLTFSNGLLLFYLFHGLLLCVSVIGIIMLLKRKNIKDESESLEVIEKQPDRIDGYRLIGTFCIGVIEGWQRASHKSDT